MLETPVQVYDLLNPTVLHDDGSQLQPDTDVNEIEWNETLLLHSMKTMPVRF
ncbi:MAG: hypothetical protein ABI690_21800 [Chloroflexota bacterium]